MPSGRISCQKSVQCEGGCGRTSKKQNPKSWKRKSCIPRNWSGKGRWLETCSLDGDSGHGGTLQGISTHEMTKATSLELAPQCIFPWQTSCRQLPHTCTHHAQPSLPYIPKCHHQYITPLPLALTQCYTEFPPHRFTLMTAILLQRRSLRHLCQHSHESSKTCFLWWPMRETRVEQIHPLVVKVMVPDGGRWVPTTMYRKPGRPASQSRSSHKT